MIEENPQQPKRAVIAAVQLPGVGDAELEASLTELRQLAKTLGFAIVGTFIQKRSDDAGTLLRVRDESQVLERLREQIRSVQGA